LRPEASPDPKRVKSVPGKPASARPAASSPQVSDFMSRMGRRDTRPELLLRRILHARGLRYRVDQPLLPDRRRRADVAFGRAKVAVFVDGCFWHGCPEHLVWPKSNEAFWRKKLDANRLRDEDTNRQLRDQGWEVVRVWEHEDMAVAASRIEQVVMARRGISRPGLGG
jgi:DNA mismatch endonuclease (patch repair protein)